MFNGELRVFHWPELDVVERKLVVKNMAAHRWRLGAGGRAWGPMVDDKDRWILAGLDIKAERLVRLGTLPDRDLLLLQPVDGSRAVILTGRTTTELRFVDRLGKERVVPEKFDTILHPSIAADGRIWFGSVSDRRRRINAYDQEGGVVLQVSDDPRNASVLSLPNGDLVLVRVGDRPGIYRCDRSASNCDVLAGGVVLEVPALSPDGENLAYVIDTPQGAVLQLMPLSGGEPRNLVTGFSACSVAWSGSEALWVSGQKNGAFLWTEIAVTSAKPTGRTAPAGGSCNWGDPDPNPPFRRSAWVVKAQESDLRLRPMPAF
jgi:hypothetical protein